MNTELENYIKELQIQLDKSYKDYTGEPFESGQINILEDVIERLKEIDSHL